MPIIDGVDWPTVDEAKSFEKEFSHWVGELTPAMKATAWVIINRYIDLQEASSRERIRIAAAMRVEE